MSFADQVSIGGGQVASGAANAGNPVKGGAVYNVAEPTAASGQVLDAQCDINGNLKTSIVNGVTSGTAGAASANVISVQGVANMTPVLTAPAAITSGGASYNNAIAPSAPAIQTVKSSAGNILGIVAFNLLSTPVFLKFFDAASPTLGTTPASFQYMIPGNTGGAGFVIQIPGQRSCVNAIKYIVSNGISYTDQSVITGSAVLVDVTYN